MHPGDDPRRSRDADPHDAGGTVIAPVPVERPRRSTRMRLALVAGLAVVVVVVGIIGPSAVGTPLIDLSGLLRRPPAATPTATAGRTTPPTATPLPRYEVFGAGGPVASIPVLTSTYALLDPLTGAISPLSADLAAGLFVGDGAGGMLCICTPWSADVERTTTRVMVISWNAEHVETGRRLVTEFAVETDGPARIGMSLGRAFTRDRAVALVASAQTEDRMWVYRLQAFDVATGERRWSIDLDRRPLREPPASPDVRETPRAGPDEEPPIGARIGSDLRVDTALSDDAVRVVATDAIHTGLGAFRIARSSWHIPLEAGRPGPSVLLGTEAMSMSTACHEGFATAQDHVSICTTVAGPAEHATVVRIDDVDGTQRHRAVLRDLGRDLGPSLIDADARRLYLWDPATHVLVAIDLATGQSRLSSWHIDGDGGIDPPPADRDVTLGSTRTSWTTVETSPGWWREPRLVGSADGRHLYAVAWLLGPVPTEPASIRSTGVFVIDARTLELIRVIPPAATHDAVSLTADGRFLLATGARGYDAGGRVSTWPRSLSIFDAQDGRLLVLVSRSDTEDGIRLVWPPPVE